VLGDAGGEDSEPSCRFGMSHSGESREAQISFRLGFTTCVGFMIFSFRVDFIMW
jgi:hypothetical protein